LDDFKHLKRYVRLNRSNLELWIRLESKFTHWL